MIGIFDLCKTICKLSGWNLTHLNLQKVLYILQLYHLGRYNKPLFFGSFEAWNYGPVEPGVYRVFSGFGADPLPEWAFLEYDLIAEEHEKSSFIKEILEFFLSKGTGFLLKFVHTESGAWDLLYQEGVKGIPIPNEEIKAEYDRRFKKNNN
jgi:uncharacterized phage-associated protein